MEIRWRQVDWEYRSVFRIAYRTLTHSQALVVEVEDGALTGRGEAVGVSYRGETLEVLRDQLASAAPSLRQGVTRAELQTLLPAGGARNALDCALWDLEAKRTGRRAWQLAGISAVRPLTTAYTLSIDVPEAMGRAAAAARRYSLLKLKLSGQDDLQRVAAVRNARPEAQLIVDANQSWTEKHLNELPPQLAKLGVGLIEQPLPRDADDVLTEYRGPIPLCADESCQTSAAVATMLGKYQYVNIKLDKTGGLTEALQLARAARSASLRLMVGCMGGSSLSMAPGFIVGQLCDVVDLDSPLLIKSDVPDAIRYEGSDMFAPEAALWG